MNHPTLDGALALQPLLRERRREIDDRRALTPDVVDALVELGAYRWLVPSSVGGLELDPETFVEGLELLAMGDGATGWIAMVGATTGLAAGYLDASIARALFPTSITTCGVFAPMGRGERDGDSYRVSGRWAFGSGCQHAAMALVGFVVDEGGGPMLKQGFVPRASLEILDTWDTSGLRGTGSHDFVIAGATIPVEHTVALTTDRPTATGTLYRFPLFGVLALGVSAVATGIARRVLDDARALLKEKRPQGAKRSLADRETVQRDLARADLELRAARALVRETITALARREGVLGVDDRALLRASATHATECAARSVDVVQRALGATSIYETHGFARAFRDVHVATQHAMVGEPTWLAYGRTLLGLPVDATTL